MSFDAFRDKSSLDPQEYVFVKYELDSTESVKKAAWDLAIGQSVGNPNVRNEWETDDLFENHSCLITMVDEENKLAEIAFPVVNTNWKEDGISHLLCQVMGGQTDIDHIIKSRAIDIEIPESVQVYFKGPQFGFKGYREYLNQYDKPLLGGIVKPKTGISPETLLEMVKQMVEGGVDFIKEDEILSNPSFCPLWQRVPLIADYLDKCGRKVVYHFCINSDPQYVLERAKYVARHSTQNVTLGVHINVWSGLGVYNSIRKMDLPLFIHYQKSGEKTFTHPKNPYGLSWPVLCELAGLSGADTIHAGMIGGYSSDDPIMMDQVFKNLAKYGTIPCLSCGMHPGLVNHIVEMSGSNDFMANVGGAIHGHPQGTLAGAKAMRQAIDKTFGPEYDIAVAKWGLVN
jgi:ribulose 1,5-bisphosphate carboxylase large subunit-like protein